MKAAIRNFGSVCIHNYLISFFIFLLTNRMLNMIIINPVILTTCFYAYKLIFFVTFIYFDINKIKSHMMY